MCMSCGCEKNDESHSDPRNITTESFEKAADAAGITVEEAERNTLNALKEKHGDAEPQDNDMDTLDTVGTDEESTDQD